MSEQDFFTYYPLTIDPETHQVSTASQSRTLKKELDGLNDLHAGFRLALDSPDAVPPPPVPVNPKRSAAVSKLRDQGNAEHRKAHYDEAIAFYTQGLDLALGRPLWEPQGLVREECSALYANRAQSHIAIQAWPQGALDAEASVECKRAGNSKAWWRRGKCLMEMGRLDEASVWLQKALELEGPETELMALLKEVQTRLLKTKDVVAAAAAADAGTAE